MTKHRVIIVGAGLSGLCAARTLLAHGVKSIVLEAEDRVGGRTHTLHPSQHLDPNYGWADFGASYVGPSQHHVLSLCEELNVLTYLCYDELDNIHYSRGDTYRMDGFLPNLWLRNPLAAWDLIDMLRKLDDMCWDIPVDKPWKAEKAKEWDSVTLMDFFNKNCWTKRAVEFLTSMCIMDNTAHPHEMSLLFYLWYMRQGNGPRMLWGVTGGAQERKLIGGSQQLAEKVAQQLGEYVKLNKPVIMIRYGSDGVTVTTLDGATYRGSHVILATPPTVQMKIHFDPPLSTSRNCLIQRSPMGLVMKCMIYYEERFWEENGYNGYVACADGIEVIGLVTEDSKPGIKYPGLICFIYRQHMIRLAKMSKEDKKNEICKSLATFFKSDKALKPIHFVSKTWPQEQYVGGGYTCYYPPGVLTQFGDALRAPIGGRLYLAGTETATHWTGYMNGAIDAGQRAAREVLHASGVLKAEDIWIQRDPTRHHKSLMEVYLPSLHTVVHVCATSLALLVALIICLPLSMLIIWYTDPAI